MKRRLIVLAIVSVLVLVGGAGYLGTRSAQSAVSSAEQAPTTVEVTRGDVQQTVTAPGQLVATHQVALAAGASGQVVAAVRAGERVLAGDVLVEIDPAPLEAQVAAAQSDLEEARAQWTQLQAGPTAAERAAAELALAQAEAALYRLRAGPAPAELAAAEAAVAAAERDMAALESLPDPKAVAQAQAELERAEVVLQQAQAAYDRVKDRPDIGMLPQAVALQQATIAHRSARAAFEAANRPATAAELRSGRARLAAARAALDQLTAGPSGDEVHLAELQVAQAQAALDQLTAGPAAATVLQAEVAAQAAERALAQAQAHLAATVLSAPFDGVVVAVEVQVGETVLSGQRLVVLTDPAAVEAETSVVEEDLPLVQVGQEVSLFFDAWPEGEIQGRVARIVPQRVPGDRPLYPVYITLDAVPEGLLAGMTVDASIVVAARDDVLCLPRALVQASSEGTATVQLWTGSQVEERQVRTGLRGDVYVEIVDGLREGEQVVSQ